MGVGAGAIGRERHLAVARPGGELRDVLGRHVLVDDGRQVAGVEPGDQREILVGIVGQFLEQDLVHDHRGRVREHQRVAVGR